MFISKYNFVQKALGTFMAGYQLAGSIQNAQRLLYIKFYYISRSRDPFYTGLEKNRGFQKKKPIWVLWFN